MDSLGLGSKFPLALPVLTLSGIFFWFFLFARLYPQHVEARRYPEEEVYFLKLNPANFYLEYSRRNVRVEITNCSMQLFLLSGSAEWEPNICICREAVSEISRDNTTNL